MNHNQAMISAKKFNDVLDDARLLIATTHLLQRQKRDAIFRQNELKSKLDTINKEASELQSELSQLTNKLAVSAQLIQQQKQDAHSRENELKIKLSTTNKEVSDLQTALSQLTNKLDASAQLNQRQKRDAFYREKEFNLERDTIKSNMNRLQLECSELTAQLNGSNINALNYKALCAVLTESDTQLQIILSSKSWKITKPFRILRHGAITKPSAKIRKYFETALQRIKK